MEGGVHHARLHSGAYFGLQHGIAGAAGQAYPVALVYAAFFGVVRVQFQPVLVVPALVAGTAGLGAYVVLAEDAAGGQQQWELAVGAFGGGHIIGDYEAALADREVLLVHNRHAVRVGVVTRPLNAAEFVEFLVGHAAEAWGQAGDFGHDLFRVVVVHGVAQGVG